MASGCRLAVGIPTSCCVVGDASVGGSVGESVIEIAASPNGQLFTVLTQAQVQFWSALRTMTLLASIPLPLCGLKAGGDAGHKMVWNPQGRSLAVATLDRRVLFLEADVALESSTVITKRPDAIELADVPSRVCVGFEIQLEFGLIVSLAATPQALVVCTSGGFLVFVGWNRGRILGSWGSSHLLQRVGPAPSCVGSAGAAGTEGLSLNSSSSLLMHTGSSTSVGAGSGVSGASNSSSRPIGGSIIYFTHCARSRLSGFVLADGSIGLIRGSNLHDVPMTSVGSAPGVYHTGLAALQVCINATHGILAVSCSDVVLRLVSFDTQTLDLLPSLSPLHAPSGGGDCNNLFAAGAAGSGSFGWCDDVKGLGNVRSMQWSNDDTTLCVAFRKRGVAVFHHSGACVMTSFSRYDGALRRNIAPGLSRGCVAACWDFVGSRLICCGVDAKELTLIPFLRVMETTGSTVSNHGPPSASTVLMGAEFISWLLADADHAGDSGLPASVADQDASASWEALDYPAEYLKENYPIQYGGVSGDGMHVACAGTHGAAVYSRRIRRWRLFSVKSQERQISCVANPCWVADLVVVLPVRNHCQKSFELQWYPRYHLNDVSILQRVRCERKPVSVRCSVHTSSRGTEAVLLCVLDSADVVRVYTVEVLSDHCHAPRSISVDVRLVRTVRLRDHYEGALYVGLCPSPRQRLSHVLRRSMHPAASTASTPPSSSAAPAGVPTPSLTMVRLLIVTRLHRLMVAEVPLEGTAAVLAHRDTPLDPGEVRCVAARLSSERERVFMVWGELGALGHLFPSSVLLLTHDSSGLTLRWLEERLHTLQPTDPTRQGPTSLSMGAAPQAYAAQPVAMWRSRVASSDVDSVPLGIAPTDGVVLLATEGLEPPLLASLPSRFRATIKPVLLMHRVLLPVVAELEIRSADGAADFDVAAEGGDGTRSGYVPVDDDGLVYATHVLQRLREQGCFIGAMDFLLHLILHDADDGTEFSRVPFSHAMHLPAPPPLGSAPSLLDTDAPHHYAQAGASPVPLGGSLSLSLNVPGLSSSRKDRKRVRLLHAAIQWLKQYPEYHTILVGVVRKIDISKWRLVFDVIGAPVDFFEDCLNTGNYVEAAHVVRVVMMDSCTQHTMRDASIDPAVLQLGRVGRETATPHAHASTITAAPHKHGGSTSLGSATTVGGRSTVGVTTTVLSPLQAALQCGLRLLMRVLSQPATMDRLHALAAELFRFLTMLLLELVGSVEPTTSLLPGVPSARAAAGSSPTLLLHVKDALGSSLSSRLKGIWSSSIPSTSTSAAPSVEASALSQQRGVSPHRVIGPSTLTTYTDPATSLPSSTSTSSTASPHQSIHAAPVLHLSFHSSHERDDAAAVALLTRFPLVRLELERCVIWDFVYRCRLGPLREFCRSFALDLRLIMSSIPWSVLYRQWRSDVAACNNSDWPCNVEAVGDEDNDGEAGCSAQREVLSIGMELVRRMLSPQTSCASPCAFTAPGVGSSPSADPPSGASMMLDTLQDCLRLAASPQLALVDESGVIGVRSLIWAVEAVQSISLPTPY